MHTDIAVAVIGIGAIGRSLAEAIHAGGAGATRLAALADKADKCARLEQLAALFDCAWTTDVLRLPDYGANLVIEAAGPEAVREYALPLLARGLDVVVMSAGALADAAFLSELEEVLAESRGRLYVPSGAIGGLDVLRAVGMDGLDEVRLTTSKPPRALRGAPWFQAHGLDLDAVTARTVLFRGSVSEAVRWFPQNVNVAAVLSLAASGARSLSVEIAVDPGSDRNLHEIYARGPFGEMTLRLANLPSPGNAKTSHLASLSPLALLRRLSSHVVIGS